MSGTSRDKAANSEGMTYRLCLGQFLKANGVATSALVKEVEGQIPRSTVYDMARKPQRLVSVAHLLALADALTRLLNREVRVDDLVYFLPTSEAML